MLSSQLFKKNNIYNWFKIFLPPSNIKYYPPTFIVRNPIMSSVKVALKDGYEVALLSFYVENFNDLSRKLGNKGLENYFQILKREFYKCIENIFNEDVLVVHDYQSEGLTAILRQNINNHSLEVLALNSKHIEECLERNMKQAFPNIDSTFNTGYMFVEKNQLDLFEAMNKAHQQAFIMAQKKEKSDYDQMFFQINQIVKNKNIELFAQPIVELGSNNEVACEILTRGPIGTDLESPLNLFSLARQMGMLYELEIIVLEKILQKMTEMNSSKNIFINFTPITVGNARFFEDFEALLKEYHMVSPKTLVLEITERDSIDNLEFISINIKKLRELGIRIAVDDTGAGYASLHTIIEIIPDVIKIDRSVIQDINLNSVKESMLKGLLLIAKDIGSTVVAEGIENEKEALILSKNKVDLAQGYFYARPLNIEKVIVSASI